MGAPYQPYGRAQKAARHEAEMFSKVAETRALHASILRHRPPVSIPMLTKIKDNGVVCGRVGKGELAPRDGLDRYSLVEPVAKGDTQDRRVSLLQKGRNKLRPFLPS